MSYCCSHLSYLNTSGFPLDSHWIPNEFPAKLGFFLIFCLYVHEYYSCLTLVNCIIVRYMIPFVVNQVQSIPTRFPLDSYWIPNEFPPKLGFFLIFCSYVHEYYSCLTLVNCIVVRYMIPFFVNQVQSIPTRFPLDSYWIPNEFPPKLGLLFTNSLILYMFLS